MNAADRRRYRNVGSEVAAAEAAGLEDKVTRLIAKFDAEVDKLSPKERSKAYDAYLGGRHH